MPVLDSIVASTERPTLIERMNTAADVADATSDNFRLTTAQVFRTFVSMGGQIEAAHKKYASLLDATPQQVAEGLAEIISAADKIKAAALKLQQANR